VIVMTMTKNSTLFHLMIVNSKVELKLSLNWMHQRTQANSLRSSLNPKRSFRRVKTFSKSKLLKTKDSISGPMPMTRQP
jgi:hypothetical protein